MKIFLRTGSKGRMLLSPEKRSLTRRISFVLNLTFIGSRTTAPVKDASGPVNEASKSRVTSWIEAASNYGVIFSSKLHKLAERVIPKRLRPLAAKTCHAWPSIALLVATVYYCVVFSSVSILTHMTIADGAHDAGVYDQLIWLLSQGQRPFSTLAQCYLGAFHVPVYCIFFAPLFWLWDSINALYLVQTLTLAFAVWPIFLYARKRLDNAFAALMIGLSFLLYPALQNMNLDNFHPEATILFFFTWMLYHLLCGNYRLFYVFLGLSLLGKEDMGFVCCFVGLYMILFRREFRRGCLVIAVSACYYFLCSKVIMPLANGLSPFAQSGPVFYSHWFAGLANNLLNPDFYWKSVFRPEARHYLNCLLAPVGYLPLLNPAILLMAVPQILVNLLSNVGYFVTITYHYDYVVTGVFFFALIQGLTIATRMRAFWKNGVLLIATLTVLVSAYHFNNQWSKLPLRRQWPVILQKLSLIHSESVTACLTGLEIIPEDAAVSASSNLFTQMSHRRTIYMFPNPFREAYPWPGEPLPAPKDNIDYVAVFGTILSKEEKEIFRCVEGSSCFDVVHRKGALTIVRNNHRVPPISSGLVYNLYEASNSVPQLVQSGTVLLPYFPPSAYFMQSLLGERLSVSKTYHLELSGYLFIPKGNTYTFNLGSSGTASLDIDGRAVRGPLRLDPGFHGIRLLHTNYGGAYGLQFSISPAGGVTYIPSDRDFVNGLSDEGLREIESRRIREVSDTEHAASLLPQLVVNGGFENVVNDQPDNWKLSAWRSRDALCAYRVDNQNALRGGYALSIAHGGAGTGVTSWYQALAVKPDTRYRLSGWIKTVDVTPKGAGAWVFVKGPSVGTTRVYGTTDWKCYEVEMRTGLEQTSVSILCRLGDYGWDNKGTAYFDDVLFQELPNKD